MDVKQDGTLGPIKEVKTTPFDQVFKIGEKVKGRLFASKEELQQIKDGKKEAPPVVIIDEKVLRTRSRETTLKEIEELKLVEKIQTALKYTWTTGYGLAAIQLGIPIRAAWYKIKYGNGTEVERLLWNPQVIKAEGFMAFPSEGCLSIPGKFMTTKRHKAMTVLNGDGKVIKAVGLEAVVLQHEIGHMNGELCTDHVLVRAAKPGRNDACPCGSGKKYKKCCLK